MALDEPKENDATAEEKGYSFCIEKDLLAKVSHVTVDFTYMGFSVTPEVPLASSGGCQSCAVGGGCAT